jgi:hypothetical protein
VSLRLELRAQLDVVEDLAVEHDREAARRVQHGLRAAAQVDDRQPAVAQRDRPVAPGALVVGAAVPQARDHPGQGAVVDPSTGELENSSDAAHASCRPTALRPSSPRIDARGFARAFCTSDAILEPPFRASPIHAGLPAGRGAPRTPSSSTTCSSEALSATRTGRS